MKYNSSTIQFGTSHMELVVKNPPASAGDIRDVALIPGSGKSPGVGCHAFLQGILPTQGSNPGLLHCRKILYHLSYWEVHKK